MRQARALPLPNEVLYIEEIKFWLKIMQEHTKFIKAGLPVEATDFLEATKEFNRAFMSLLQKSEKLKSVKQSNSFIEEIIEVVNEFYRFQKKILSENLLGKLRGTNFPFFLDHMLREAKCFCEFLNRMQDEKKLGKVVSHTKEIVIWLRFMSDHTKLIAHYIDPSECRMSKMVNDFVELFDHLVLEARDLASMLYCHKGEVRAFHRFLLDIRVDIQRLRDFNKMAEDLIADCRLLGIMSVELAGHMKRETEHCLLKIALLEKELVKHCPDDFQDDVDDTVWEEPERLEDDDDNECDYVEDDNEEYMDEIDNSDMTNERMEKPADNKLEVDEPVIAILPPDNKKNEALEITNKPINDEIPKDVLRSESKNEQIVISEIVETPKAEPIEQKATVYQKAGEHKHMPRNFVGAAPGERYLKPKKQQNLPRPLGKAKK